MLEFLGAILDVTVRLAGLVFFSCTVAFVFTPQFSCVL